MSNVPRRILVIEDDLYIREAIGEVLESEGYGVGSASNGQEALDLLRRDPGFDLILLDLMMPVKDGFAFRNEQLADARIRDIPVVVMSADGRMEENKARVAAQEYLRKPIDLDAMIEVARRCSGAPVPPEGRGEPLAALRLL